MRTLSDFRRAGWVLVKAYRGIVQPVQGKRGVRWFAFPGDCIPRTVPPAAGYHSWRECRRELDKYLTMRGAWLHPAAEETARQVLTTAGLFGAA